jgi:hypothetical protein
MGDFSPSEFAVRASKVRSDVARRYGKPWPVYVTAKGEPRVAEEVLQEPAPPEYADGEQAKDVCNVIHNQIGRNKEVQKAVTLHEMSMIGGSILATGGSLDTGLDFLQNPAQRATALPRLLTMYFIRNDKWHKLGLEIGVVQCLRSLQLRCGDLVWFKELLAMPNVRAAFDLFERATAKLGKLPAPREELSDEVRKQWSGPLDARDDPALAGARTDVVMHNGITPGFLNTLDGPTDSSSSNPPGLEFGIQCAEMSHDTPAPPPPGASARAVKTSAKTSGGGKRQARKKQPVVTDDDSAVEGPAEGLLLAPPVAATVGTTTTAAAPAKRKRPQPRCGVMIPDSSDDSDAEPVAKPTSRSRSKRKVPAEAAPAAVAAATVTLRNAAMAPVPLDKLVPPTRVLAAATLSEKVRQYVNSVPDNALTRAAVTMAQNVYAVVFETGQVPGPRSVCGFDGGLHLVPTDNLPLAVLERARKVGGRVGTGLKCNKAGVWTGGYKLVTGPLSSDLRREVRSGTRTSSLKTP